MIICGRCGRQNPESQQSCAVCGADLLKDGETMQELDLYGQTMVDVEVPQLEETIPAAHLTLESGRFSGRAYRLGANQTIGREKCEIILRDPQASRQHASVNYLEGQFLLIDLGSANHTFVNDQMIQKPTPLMNGDVIGIGDTSLKFSISDPEG